MWKCVATAGLVAFAASLLYWNDVSANPLNNPSVDFSDRNLVIDGDMRIIQGGATFNALTASQYTLDNWAWEDEGTTSASINITQTTTVPTVAQAGIDLENSIRIDVATAETLGTDERLLLVQRIEAQDVTHFGHGNAGALPAYLSFWIRSTITGVMAVNLDRPDGSERFIREVTISAADTWEYKSVVFPGDTDGTDIADDTGIGLVIEFVMAAGSSNDAGTADVWGTNADTSSATANQANLLSDAANDVYISGVKFSMGSVDKPFRPAPYSYELARTQRYYNRINYADDQDIVGTGFSETTTVCQVHVTYPQMRAAPTITDNAGDEFEVLHQGTVSASSSVATTVGITPTGFNFEVTTGAVQTAGEGCLVRSDTTGVYIEMDARL